MIIQDKFETVINDPETYIDLAFELKHRRVVVFAWTDQDCTQLDILLAYHPAQYGHLQRGMNAKADLFVAVSSFGMFGFSINGLIKYPSYVGEKLCLGSVNNTTIRLAELINGICGELI